MIIYEMTFTQLPDDPISQLYFQNTVEMRELFIEQIKYIISLERNQDLICNQSLDKDLICFLNEAYNEVYECLSNMKNEFIEHGTAIISPIHSLTVLEKQVI